MLNGSSLDKLWLMDAIGAFDRTFEALGQVALGVNSRHCFEGGMHVLGRNLRRLHPSAHWLSRVAVDREEEI